MISTDKNIVVNAEICSKVPCAESCAPNICQLCLPCLNQDDINSLHSAYREHMRKGDTKRIFPQTNINEEAITKLSPKNQMLTRWYQSKCKLDSMWC